MPIVRSVAFDPGPPHDCRLTHRCLKDTFDFGLPLDRDFASLRSENSLIDRFFDRREGDEQGGEGAERVQQISTKPAFKLTSGRMRGATWFEKNRPPQGIVWLLGAELHDERHKGGRDAYDILAALDGRGQLFPQQIDYKRLELDRRRWDTESFAEDVVRDGRELFGAAQGAGTARASLVGVPSRMVIEEESARDGAVAEADGLYVRVGSTRWPSDSHRVDPPAPAVGGEGRHSAAGDLGISWRSRAPRRPHAAAASPRPSGRDHYRHARSHRHVL